MKTFLSILLCFIQLLPDVASFAPTTTSFATRKTLDRIVIKPEQQNKNERAFATFPQHVLPHSNKHSELFASNADDGILSNLKINPTYALPYLLFIIVAGYQSSIEPTGASTAVIEKFIANPINPGINTLFCVVFNYLGLIAFPMGCLLMPGSKGQSLPAPPFIIGSMAAGYGSIGLYMSTRKSKDDIDLVDNEKELGFVTKNILENKIFNWIVVGLALSTLVSTGFVTDVISDTQGLIGGFGDVLSSSALGAVSTLDLMILTLTGASLIPEDLERRGVVDDGKAKAIAASTVFLPVLGLTLYCALRPALPEE